MAVFSRTTNLLEHEKDIFENNVSDPRLSTMVAIAWVLDVDINQMFRVEKLKYSACN